MEIEINWKELIGCACLFKEDAKLYIYTTLKTYKFSPDEDTQAHWVTLTRYDEDHVYVTMDGIRVFKINKENCNIIVPMR
jgi:hypothetical protein